MNWILRFLTAITTHKGDVSAHHAKTTLFTTLTDRWSLAQAYRGTDGKIMIFKGAGADPEEGDLPAGGGGTAIFGDGEDGDVTIASDTDLVRDMFYNTLTVNNTFTLSTKGFRIFVKGTLTNNGTIENNGGDATNGGDGGPGDERAAKGIKGAGTSQAVLGNSGQGGDGGAGADGNTAGGTGSNGADVTNALGGLAADGGAGGIAAGTVLKGAGGLGDKGTVAAPASMTAAIALPRTPYL